MIGLATAFLASVLEVVTVLLLDPLLKVLFGRGLTNNPGPADEGPLLRLISPFIEGVPPSVATQRLVILFVATLAIKITSSYVSNYCNILVQEGVARDLRVRLWQHLMRLDLSVFLRTRGGQVAAGLVSDADQVKQVVAATLASFFQNAVLILAILVAMFSYSPRLTLMVLVLAPFLVGGVQVLRGRIKRHARDLAHERGELTAAVTERLGAVKLIRAFGAEATESEAFARHADRYRKGQVRTQRFLLLTSPVSELFGGALIMLVIWAAANSQVSGVSLDLASTIAFVILAARLMSPIKSLAQAPTLLAIAEASGERIFDMLDLPATETDSADAIPAVFQRDLVFDTVSFGYDPMVPVVRDVSLAVRKGEVVALVGPSGAGKTTLLELITRFHDPQHGEIRLDGVPLSRLQRRSLRDLIAVVSQDTVLLHDTVRANIAYGSPAASDAGIEAAAAAANAEGFIRTLPDGYATVLGERGTRLSGGQRQRIAIARALLRDAPILVLDEATSALDPESERLVQEAIDRLMKDRTVLVIAHRLATVREADRIVVLEEGRAIETGTHAELVTRGGLYRRLYDLQFSSAEVTM